MSDASFYLGDPDFRTRVRKSSDISGFNSFQPQSRMAPRRLRPTVRPLPQPALTLDPRALRAKASMMNEFVPARRLRPSTVQMRQTVAKPMPQPTLLAKPLEKPRPAPAQVPSEPRATRSQVLKRQSVKQLPKHAFTVPDKVKKAKQPRDKAQIMMTSMALLIFMVGLWVSFSTWRTNHSVKSKVSALSQSAEHSSDATITGDQVPSETPPKGNINNYKVAADLPRFISIDKLKVKARVLRLSVGTNNELKTPASIYDAGWYDGSAKPGTAGAVLIDGHVNGPTYPGVFFGLKKLVVGDTIDIEKGDGQIIHYKVVKSQSYPKDQVDMTAALTSAVPGKQGLNLITCDGKPVSGKDFTYDHRLVVFAVRAD